MTTRKERIIAGLYAWIRQRSGMDPRNYGDCKSYRSEQRSVTKDLNDARQLIRAVELRDSISADAIIHASKHAFSGRLTITERDDGTIAIAYCTGQYFPTEYRRAVAAVMASALWDWQRSNMPASQGRIKRTSGVGVFAHESEHDNIEGLTPGDWLRRAFKREFGRGIARGYFS